jgi:hypothetical protein
MRLMQLVKFPLFKSANRRQSSMRIPLNKSARYFSSMITWVIRKVSGGRLLGGNEVQAAFGQLFCLWMTISGKIVNRVVPKLPMQHSLGHI